MEDPKIWVWDGPFCTLLPLNTGVHSPTYPALKSQHIRLCAQSFKIVF